MLSVSLFVPVRVADAIGGHVGVMVGVSVSVGVDVMVGVSVGVKVALGGSVSVRLGTGFAVGTGDDPCRLTNELPVGGMVAANGVCCAGWQAAISNKNRSDFQQGMILLLSDNYCA